MTGSEIYLKFKAWLEDKVTAALGRIGTAVGNASKAAAKLGSAMGTMFSSLEGPAGKFAGVIGNAIGAVKQIGPLGAVFIASQAVINLWANHAKEKVEEFTAAVNKMAERVRSRYEEVNAQRLDKLAESLKEATTLADRSARAFDAMAAAWMKVNDAKSSADQAGWSQQVAKLERTKAEAMAGTSGNDRAKVGADFDIMIAEKRLGALQQGNATKIARAEKELDDAQKREQMARQRTTAAEKALADARRELALTRDVDAKNEKTFTARVEAAESALAAAKNDSVAKTAAREAAQEALRKANSEAGAGEDAAATALVNAKRAKADLQEAEKKAKADEAIRKQKEKELDEEKRHQEKQKELQKQRREQLEKLVELGKKEKRAMQDEIDCISKVIEKANNRADAWEQNAQKVRGRTFNDLERERRNADRNGPSEFERQNAANRRKAVRLTTDEKRGIPLSAKAWLERYRDWEKAQDPMNNEAAKEAERLEQQRERARQKMQRTLEQIHADLTKSLNVN